MSILPDVTSKPTCTRTVDEYRFKKDGLNWGWRDFIKHEDFDKEKHLRDDCLTLLCDVTVAGPDTEDYIEVATPESTVVAAPEAEPGVVTAAPAVRISRATRRSHLEQATSGRQDRGRRGDFPGAPVDARGLVTRLQGRPIARLDSHRHRRTTR